MDLFLVVHALRLFPWTLLPPPHGHGVLYCPGCMAFGPGRLLVNCVVSNLILIWIQMAHWTSESLDRFSLSVVLFHYLRCVNCPKLEFQRPCFTMLRTCFYRWCSAPLWWFLFMSKVGFCCLVEDSIVSFLWYL